MENLITSNLIITKDAIEEIENTVKMSISAKVYEYSKVIITPINIIIISDNAIIYIIERINKDTNNLVINNYKYWLENHQFSNNNIVKNNVYNIWDRYQRYLGYCPLIYSVENAREDPEFERLLSLKIDEGINYYKIQAYNNKIMIPMFAGLILVKKQDSVSLFVYDIDINHYLVYLKLYNNKTSKDMMFRILKI